MARKDRTFTDKDLIRILSKNLDRIEKLSVLAFFGLEPQELLEVPKVKDLQGKIASASQTLDALIAELGTVQRIAAGLALIPGPQRLTLEKISVGFEALLTIAALIRTILG